MREVEVAGIRTTMLAPFGHDAPENSVEKELYYLINISELTWETLVRRQKTPVNASAEEARRVRSANTETWTQHHWETLAAWMYVSKYRAIGGVPAMEGAAKRLRGEFIKEPYNWWCKDAIRGDVVPGKLPDGYPDWGGRPVILTLRAACDELPNAFRKWYGKELRGVKSRQVDQQLAGVRGTLGKAVAAMNEVVSRRERTIVRPLRDGLTRFAAGEAVFQAEFDFAGPAAVRKKKWAGKADGWEHDYVMPPPMGPQKKRLRVTRDRWSKVSMRCQSTLAEAVSPESLDPLASRILHELRKPDALVYIAFADWGELSPGSRAELLHLLTEAVGLAMRGKSSRRALLHGELAAIVHLASDEAAADGPPGLDDFSTRIREAHDALSLPGALPLDPGTAERPLTKVMASGFKSIRLGTRKAAMALDLLSLATPHVYRHIGAGQNTDTRRLAVLWRILVGSTRGTPHDQDGLFAVPKEIGRLVATGKPSADSFLVKDKGVLSRAHARGAPYFQIVAVVTDLMLLEETLRANSSSDDPLAVAKSVAATCKYARTFGSFMVSLPKTLELSGVVAEAELSALAQKAGSSSKVVPILGLIAAAATLYVSAEAARPAGLKRTLAEQQKLDDARLFDALSTMMALLTVAAGFEFVLLGMIVFAVREAVLNPDSWLPAVVPGIEFKTRPHKYVVGVLEALWKDGKFVDAMDAAKTEKLPSAGLLETEATALRGYLKLPVASDTPNFWDLEVPAGPYHVTLRDKVANALEQVYGLPPTEAARLAGET